MEVLTQSAPETQELGARLANNLIGEKSASIVCLYGDLGSGKTTFVQGLANSLGIKSRVLSPTFILMRQYAIHYKQYANFYHVDLYRVKGERDIETLGLKEIFSEPTNIVAMEWPEKIEDILPKNRIDVKFEYIDDKRRKITIANC